MGNSSRYYKLIGHFGTNKYCVSRVVSVQVHSGFTAEQTRAALQEKAESFKESWPEMTEVTWEEFEKIMVG